MKLEKSCKCNESNKKYKKALAVDKKKSIDHMNKRTAQTAFKQLQKGLSSIVLDVLSVDSIGYEKEIKECDISSLTARIRTQCTDDSLYSLISQDPKTNIDNLHKSFNQEVNGFYKDFNKGSNFIIDKDKLSENGNCSLNDRTAFQVSTLVSNIKFASKSDDMNIAYLNDPISFNIKEHLTMEERSYYNSIPYYRELINSNSIDKNSFNSLPSSLINNDNIKSKIVSNLKIKCEQTYKKAIDTLCKSNKNNSSLDYKTTRKELKAVKENKLEFQAQYLEYICTEKDTKDISGDLNFMNEQLPDSQQHLASIEIVTNTYNASMHSVRERLCSFIPEQVDSIEDGLKKMGCTEGSFSEDCLYLETYKKLLDQSEESITYLDTNNNIASIKSTKNSSKSNFIFNKPSALVSSFIAIDPVEDKEENTSLVQKEDVSVEKEVSKVSVTPSVSRSNSKNVNKALKKQRFKETNKSKHQIETKETYYPNHQTVSSNSIQETQKDKEMNDFYKGLAEKIRRSKSQNKYESKSISRSKNLLDRSKRNLNKAKEIMRNIASAQDNTFKSNRDSNLDTNYQNDEDIQEMINDQMHADSNFGSSNNYNPSKGNSSRSRKGYNSKLSSESIEKGYAYQNIFGDTITKQGIEANYIDNKGFQGEIIGDKALEFVFLGELEQDPDKINLDEILTLDNSKGNIESLIASIDTGKPFFIRSASSPNERILVKPSGGDFEFIKFSDDDSREFNKFYRKVKKAFKKKFYAKTRSKNSVVSASGY